MSQATTHTIQVWDIWLRLFHWALVLSVAAALASGLAGGDWMLWHERAGLTVATLIGFRLVWGLAGSQTARFASFVRGPRAIGQYLRGQWHGTGHNPLGALSVVAILLLLTAQVLTGLFANDEIAFSGPLSRWVSDDTSIWLTGKHRLLVYGVYALLGLHVAAIVAYRVFKRESLVPPMLHGQQQVATDIVAPKPAPRWAWPLAALGGAAAWALASGLWPR